ncbi:unnamed protein product [Miscanthus lutarioriparius]|uniref:ARID domain-containing protein n=1 Tax=Miscanthus lutarioriparius TaxID=422564 RepID=A0A811PQB4_9POAL|nr:unnamed protein product [Miscanthus lutarioriparius]
MRHQNKEQANRQFRLGEGRGKSTAPTTPERRRIVVSCSGIRSRSRFIWRFPLEKSLPSHFIQSILSLRGYHMWYIGGIHFHLIQHLIHFRHALMSVIQSSCSHTWDAFQLAHASFRLYRVRNNYVQSVKLGPRLLGDAPKTNIIPAGNEVNKEEGCSEGFPAIRIYDEDVNMKFLVCGVPCTLDACLLGALEDGLNALLNIEVLKHLAPEISYRSLVALGIAWVNGTPVSSFDRQDADRLLFFCSNQCKDKAIQNVSYAYLSSWSASLTKDRATGTGSIESKQMSFGAKGVGGDNKMSLSSLKPRLKPATMRPIPHSRKQQMHPFMRKIIIRVTIILVTVQPSIPLNPLPMKKHECNRLPINLCSEEDSLKDVTQFLLQRGHDRLVPQGGLAEFPDAVLNSKRLDLYNLYKEVVYRGGFHLGNGINWKGQVFSKMRNHTVTNKMTGVGNTLKRHYETYLLEYELAHDDIEEECCLFCRSSDLGDWVNCGVCGEWVHLGCDRRQGLGNFKVEAC